MITTREISMLNKNISKKFNCFFKMILITVFLLPFCAFLMDSWERDVENSPSGIFDFYVYAITWQPSFCQINNINTGSNEFKLHGVWPYFKTPETSSIKNYHPSFCLASPGCSSFEVCDITNETINTIQNDPVLKAMLPDNPQKLLAHEWIKHGICSGLNQQDYFFLAKNFKNKVDYKNLEDLIKEKNGEVITRKEVMDTLPESTSLWCKQHNGVDYLYEVHFFLDKSGNNFFDTDTQIGNPCPETFIAPVMLFENN
jgi:ribonuclease T2